MSDHLNDITVRELSLDLQSLNNSLDDVLHCSMEDMSSIKEFLGKAAVFLRNKIPMMPKTHLYQVDDVDAVKIINEKPYVVTRNLHIVAPDNMSASWLEYIAILEDAYEICSKLDSDVLAPLDIHISRLINKPELLTDVSETRVSKIDDIEKSITAIQVRFNEAHSRLEGPYKFGMAVARLNDLPTAISKINALNKKSDSLDRSDILKRVNKISSKIDTLIENLRALPPEIKVSGVSTKALSGLVHQAAKVVEFLTIYIYSLEHFTDTMNKSLDKMKESLAPKK